MHFGYGTVSNHPSLSILYISIFNIHTLKGVIIIYSGNYNGNFVVD